MSILQEITEPFAAAIKAARKPRGFTPKPYVPQARNTPRQHLMLSDELQRAQKAIPYNQYVADFINDTGLYGQLYTDHQLEGAYRTSTYLFAALRRFASLMSEIELVGEQRKGDSWVRLPETHALNRIFIDAGRRFMFDLAIYYALFGKELVYKRKTRRAVYARSRGQKLGGFLEGGIAGVHLIPNIKWTIYEDSYHDTIQGFNLNEPDSEVGGYSRMLEPWEVVYIHDFDARDPNDGVSMASLAINDAVTNAAIARWMSHYFMSGAMPLLLVSTVEEPSLMTAADLQQYKNLIERTWQGVWGRFSLRAVFTDRKLEANQVGIKAEEVAAPEQDRTALNHIASVFQFAPDLIVPPEGGSDNARHKFLLLDAYHSAILPFARKVADQFTESFELEGKYRIVAAEDKIKALEVERAEKADTEISIFGAGLTKYGEAQERLDSDQIPELGEMVMIGGKLRSPERIIRDNNLADSDTFQYIQNGWLDGGLLLSEYRRLAYGLDLPKGIEDGYIWEIDPRQIADLEAKRLQNAQIAMQIRQMGVEATSIQPPPNPPNLPPNLPANPDNLNPTGGAETPAVESVVNEGSGDPMVAEIETTHYAHETPVRQIEQLDTPEPIPVEKIDLSEREPEVLEAEIAVPSMEDSVPNPVYVLLSFPMDSMVLTARQALAAIVGEEAATWQAPEDYHVTLVFCEDASDSDLEKVLKLLPAQIPSINLRVDGLIAFDTPDGTCVALKVELDNELAALQSQIRTAFHAYNLPLSAYSRGEDYKPHITLGYLRKESPLPDYQCSFVIEPPKMIVGRSDKAVVCEMENIRLYAARMIEDAAGDVVPLQSGLDDLPPDVAHTVGADREEPQVVTEIAQHDEIQRALDQIESERETMRGALATWSKNGSFPEGLGRLAQAAEELLTEFPKSRVLSALKQAVDEGAFDREAPYDDAVHAARAAASGKAEQMDAEEELKAWLRKAIQQGAAKAAQKFVANKMPLEVENLVRSKLPDAADKAAIRSVFDEARELLKAMTKVEGVDEDSLSDWAERISGDPELEKLLGGNDVSSSV